MSLALRTPTALGETQQETKFKIGRTAWAWQLHVGQGSGFGEVDALGPREEGSVQRPDLCWVSAWPGGQAVMLGVRGQGAGECRGSEGPEERAGC